jgi:hypothetical protein
MTSRKAPDISTTSLYHDVLLGGHFDSEGRRCVGVTISYLGGLMPSR